MLLAGGGLIRALGVEPNYASLEVEVLAIMRREGHLSLEARIMTDEELRNKIEFIIEQPAQLVVNQEKAEERITRLENAQIQTERRMGELAEAQTRMSRAQEHMNEVIAIMAEAQSHTDERLDTFIGVLERFINEGRNGKSESE